MSKTKIISCRILEQEINKIVPDNIDVEYLDYGLHNTPEKLHQELQRVIDNSSEYDTMLFGYGLCSKGTAGLQSKGQQLVIPLVHDCISLLLGSGESYMEQFKKYPGSYYLSKGWIKQEGDPLSSYHRYCERYGEKKAAMVIKLEYANYKRLAYIHTVGDCPEDLAYGQKVADFLHIEFVELEGSLRLLQKMINRQWDNEFIRVSPGDTIVFDL